MSGFVVGRPRPPLAPVVLLGDEFAVPPQDHVGCDDAGDRGEGTTAEDMAFHGETASLVVGQAQSLRAVHRAENAILLQQVVDDRLLVSIYPASEQQQTECERTRQRIHGGSLAERVRNCGSWSVILRWDS